MHKGLANILQMCLKMCVLPVSPSNALTHVAIMASTIRIVIVWVELLINGRQSEKIIYCELSLSIFGETSHYLREFNSHRSMSVRRALQKHCWGRVTHVDSSINVVVMPEHLYAHWECLFFVYQCSIQQVRV